MQELVLKNGIKLIYEKSMGMLTSVSIGLEAGASVEDDILGLAHATEHMVFKGTKHRSEVEINEEFSKLFCFSNAMTNYPYVIYYGTLLGEDLKKGIELLSDILIYPTFPLEGFKEEMNTIVEELKEWDEELDQYCEDKLFIYSFIQNRLKYPIIGREKDLKSITLEDIKKFYKKYYSPQNTSIAIVSSLELEEVKEIVEASFLKWEGNEVYINESNERPLSGVRKDIKTGINTCRVEMVYDIKNLTYTELKAFRVFNEFFAEGINSVLFNNLRTKNGLVYDVLSAISNEKHIGLYKIMFNVSERNIDKALDIIEKSILQISDYKEILTTSKIKELSKSVKLKKLFKEEQTVRLANNLVTHSVMFDNMEEYKNMLDGLDNLDAKFILDTGIKLLKNPSIEIIVPR